MDPPDRRLCGGRTAADLMLYSMEIQNRKTERGMLYEI